MRFSCFLLLVFLTAELHSGETSNLHLGGKGLDSLPHFGRGEITNEFKLELGKVFVGEKKFGLVTLKNPTKSTIKIKDVKSSCGCTAIYPVEKSLHPGGEIDIAISLRPSSVGPIKSTITLITSFNTSAIQIFATGQAPLVLAESQVEAIEGKCKFSIRVSDKRINPEALSVFAGNEFLRPYSVEGQTVKFEYVCNSKNYAVVTPRYEGKYDFGTYRLLITHPGQFQLITTSVNMFPNENERQFRLLVRGDHRIDPKTRTAKLLFKEQEVEARVSCKQLGSIFHINAMSSEAAEGNAKMLIDGKELQFQLRSIP